MDLFFFFREKYLNLEIISSSYIDQHNKNISLDRKYSKLIENNKKIKEEAPNCCIVIDDYGVGFELKNRLNYLKSFGAEIIVETKADVNYVCSSLASLVARRARILEMDKLSKENVLIDPETNNRVVFTSGAPNQETKKWLETYRKIYPYSDFPSFVRLKWGNVKAVEEAYPKKRLDYIFKCEHKNCRRPTNILLFFSDKRESIIYCPNCKNPISKEYFLKTLPNLKITLDTSSLIHRAISKDLSNTGYLEGSELILTSTLYEEIDSKQPDKKKGAMNELEYIKDFTASGVLNFKEIDTEEYRDLANDKKFISVIKRHKSILMTKDSNLSTFSSLGVLVLKLIQDKSELNK